MSEMDSDHIQNCINKTKLQDQSVYSAALPYLKAELKRRKPKLKWGPRMKQYAQVLQSTPQSEKVPGVKKQVENNAGGVSFKISKWDYLMRFLILGTEGGTYYVKEQKLTLKNIDNVLKCIEKNGRKAVDLAVEVSDAGRAANNDAAIFVLALAASSKDADTRKYALDNLSKVCRIGTHLFHFVAYVRTMRGFGHGLRKAIAKWYVGKETNTLAYQLFKYAQRDGWSHRDVLRLCHAAPKNPEQQALFNCVVSGGPIPPVSDFTKGMLALQAGMDVAEVVKEYKLTREVLPTESLNDKRVWEALLDHMPMGALVRNLGKMASIGLHTQFSNTVKQTIEKLQDERAIKNARLHPLAVLNALKTYSNGCGFRGNLKWEPNSNVTDALEGAFYKSFKYVEPTGKNIMLALDVSGSMKTHFADSFVTCREASAVLAKITVDTEPFTFVTGFTYGGLHYKNAFSVSGYAYKQGISELPLRKNQALADIIHQIAGLPFNATDCSLPMLYCIERGIDVDAIVIYTDNETWAGNIHPWQALDQYQEKVGHPVKLIVVGMTATRFSIARPDYPNMLDVVGFDMNTPAAISEFIRG
jgi:60 kDa SS-A/Ro ribonucleoprotein